MDIKHADGGGMVLLQMHSLRGEACSVDMGYFSPFVAVSLYCECVCVVFFVF